MCWKGYGTKRTWSHSSLERSVCQYAVELRSSFKMQFQWLISSSPALIFSIYLFFWHSANHKEAVPNSWKEAKWGELIGTDESFWEKRKNQKKQIETAVSVFSLQSRFINGRIVPDGSLDDRTILPIKSSLVIPPLKSQTLTTRLDSGNSTAATLKLSKRERNKR